MEPSVGDQRSVDIPILRCHHIANRRALPYIITGKGVGNLPIRTSYHALRHQGQAHRIPINHPLICLEAIKADNQGRIIRSPLLTYPLSGRAGLLREISAHHNHGAVSDQWARSLGGRQIWICSPKSDFTNFHNTAFHTFIHDEAIQSIIAGLEKHMVVGSNPRCQSIPLRSYSHGSN